MVNFFACNEYFGKAFGDKFQARFLGEMTENVKCAKLSMEFVGQACAYSSGIPFLCAIESPRDVKSSNSSECHYTQKGGQKRKAREKQSQCSLIYPYLSLSDFTVQSSDHGSSKTQTKTQTSPDSVLVRERRNSDHVLSFCRGETQTMV